MASAGMALKMHRTLHFLDLLFEQVAQQENADRMATEVNAMERLAAEKEKAARGEEARFAGDDDVRGVLREGGGAEPRDRVVSQHVERAVDDAVGGDMHANHLAEDDYVALAVAAAPPFMWALCVLME